MNYLNIKLKATDNHEYSVTDFKGQRLVLYFYPKDNTSGCTLEAKEFTQLKEEFSAKGYKIIGVSRDSLASHRKFIAEHDLDILLLSDPNQELANAFDVIKEKSMYGKKYLGTERSTFLIDEDGKILKEYRGVSAANHAKIVLEEI
ncbi:MAG: peroxiredoxin [Bacilli bacterium]|nr:peroxiredoxin [Bacilli bacterium]MBN2696805.1 peroxiredoxin [Bacilli bacterium]